MLVLNNTRVIPARLYGKKETGGKIEILLLKKIQPSIWEVLIRGKIKEGMQILFDEISGTVLKKMMLVPGFCSLIQMMMRRSSV